MHGNRRILCRKIISVFSRNAQRIFHGKPKNVNQTLSEGTQTDDDYVDRTVIHVAKESLQPIDENGVLDEQSNPHSERQDRKPCSFGSGSNMKKHFKADEEAFRNREEKKQHPADIAAGGDSFCFKISPSAFTTQAVYTCTSYPYGGCKETAFYENRQHIGTSPKVLLKVDKVCSKCHCNTRGPTHDEKQESARQTSYTNARGVKKCYESRTSYEHPARAGFSVHQASSCLRHYPKTSCCRASKSHIDKIPHVYTRKAVVSSKQQTEKDGQMTGPSSISEVNLSWHNTFLEQILDGYELICSISNYSYTENKANTLRQHHREVDESGKATCEFSMQTIPEFTRCNCCINNFIEKESTSLCICTDLGFQNGIPVTVDGEHSALGMLMYKCIPVAQFQVADKCVSTNALQKEDSEISSILQDGPSADANDFYDDAVLQDTMQNIYAGGDSYSNSEVTLQTSKRTTSTEDPSNSVDSVSEQISSSSEVPEPHNINTSVYQCIPVRPNEDSCNNVLESSNTNVNKYITEEVEIENEELPNVPVNLAWGIVGPGLNAFFDSTDSE